MRTDFPAKTNATRDVRRRRPRDKHQVLNSMVIKKELTLTND